MAVCSLLERKQTWCQWKHSPAAPITSSPSHVALASQLGDRLPVTERNEEKTKESSVSVREEEEGEGGICGGEREGASRLPMPAKSKQQKCFEGITAHICKSTKVKSSCASHISHSPSSRTLLFSLLLCPSLLIYPLSVLSLPLSLLHIHTHTLRLHLLLWGWIRESKAQ